MEVSEEWIDPLSHYNMPLSVYHHVLLELGHSLLCQTALWYPSLDKWRDHHLEICSRSSWKCQQIMPPTFEIVDLSERKLDCSQIELVQDFWWLTAPLGMKADLLLWHSSSLLTWCLWHVITNIVRQRTPKGSHHILTSPLRQRDTPYRKTYWHSQLRILQLCLKAKDQVLTNDLWQTCILEWETGLLRRWVCAWHLMCTSWIESGPPTLTQQFFTCCYEHC